MEMRSEILNNFVFDSECNVKPLEGFEQRNDIIPKETMYSVETKLQMGREAGRSFSRTLSN